MALRYSAKDGERYYCCPRVPYCTGRLATDSTNEKAAVSEEALEARPAHLDFSLPEKWLKFKRDGLALLAKEKAEEEAAKKKGGTRKVKEKAPKFRVLAQNRYPKEHAHLRGLIDDKKHEDEIQRCTCSPEDGGCDDDCVNRLLYTECVSGYCSCSAKDESGADAGCDNMVFQHSRYPKTVPWKTVDKGWGLRVLQDVKKGTKLCEYTGEVITKEECQQRMREKSLRGDEDVYFMALAGDLMLDADQYIDTRKRYYIHMEYGKKFSPGDYDCFV